MKALTLWQPWASLIDRGVKTIETRSWAAPRSLIGKRIAIHAAKRPPDVEGAQRITRIGDWWIEDTGFGTFTMHRDDSDVEYPLPLGAVLSTAELVDCLPMIDSNDPVPMIGGFVYVDPDFIQIHADADDSAPTYIEDQIPYGDFASGRWAWLLDDMDPVYPPLPSTGRQGLWDIYI